MTKAVTYKFIKGQGWVAGYWEEERKWARGESVWAQAAREWARMPLQNIPLEPRQMRNWNEPNPQQIPRAPTRAQRAYDDLVRRTAPVTIRTAPPRERYIVDDPTTAFREVALWARALDDE